MCGAGTCDPLHRQQFVVPDNHPLSDGYDVIACQGCGMVYADSTVDQGGYDAFYSNFSKYPDEQDNYTGGGKLLAESGPPWDRTRLRETATILGRFLGEPATPVLDVGCANGTLLVELRQLGYSNLTGMDPSPEAAANAGANNAIRGVVGSLHALPPELGQFGAVVVAHVLEHVWDVAGAMSSLRDAVAPRGLVYAEVPDASKYADYLFAPFHDFSTEHINHFSLDLLLALFARWGFEPLNMGSRLVELGPDIPFPVIHGVWRRIEGPIGATPEPPSPDKDLGGQIGEYIARSNDLLVAFDQHLQAELKEASEVIVWGVGELAMKLLQLPALEDRDVVLVDSGPSKQGLKVRGVAVIAPGEIADLRCPIVVGSVHHSRSIVKGIQRLGLTNRLVTLESAGRSDSGRAAGATVVGGAGEAG